MKAQRIPWFRIFEITFGCCVAIAVAMALGLLNPMSAGVIAILSIQDTKRATLLSALERFSAFALSMLLAYLCFSALGYNVLAFGLYLLPFAFLCYLLKLHASIPICTVLVTHYWIAGNMSLPILLNSIYLMLIGTTIGILLNLFQPYSVKLIKQEQVLIEVALQRVLSDFADTLRSGVHSHTLQTDLISLAHALESAQHKALSLLGNTLTRDVRYYVRYVDLRIAQASILDRMAETLTAQTYKPLPQALPIASLFSHIATVLHETNDAAALLARAKTLLDSYRSEPLPETRSEFEARALLFMLLLDLSQFLTLKKTFYQSLTVDERRQYFGPLSFGNRPSQKLP